MLQYFLMQKNTDLLLLGLLGESLRELVWKMTFLAMPSVYMLLLKHPRASPPEEGWSGEDRGKMGIVYGASKS